MNDNYGLSSPQELLMTDLTQIAATATRSSILTPTHNNSLSLIDDSIITAGVSSPLPNKSNSNLHFP